jgi:arylsulfatase A-like enzyme
MLYEGGVRVPFIFRWPGHIAADATNDEPIITVDIYPTLLDLAHSQPPKNYPLDGLSLVQLLTEKKPLNRDALYWHFPGYLGVGSSDDWRTTPAGAIRVGDFKLLEFFETGKLELYNLKDDISQKNNLAESMPDKAKALHDKLVAWRNQIGAKMPAPNTEQDKTAVKKGRNRKNREQSEEE